MPADVYPTAAPIKISFLNKILLMISKDKNTSFIDLKTAKKTTWI